MLTLEEAWERLLALAPRMPVVETPTSDPAARYLAADLSALRTQPPADLSAMDGYAVSGAPPWTRIGESRAGEPFGGSLEPGQCTRISTGAWMPEGADRVVIQENAEVTGEAVTLATGEHLPQPSAHLRKRGFDFSQGDALLKRGTLLGPAQRALAMAAGHDRVPHYEAPSVSILDSGDELAALPSQCGPNQIPASNGPMIAAMIAPWAARIRRLGPIPDDRKALANALAKVDDPILITTGGASVGDHDLIKNALRDWGATLDFWKVAIKPGKPLMIATRPREGGHQVILGLPGNPVSSFVTGFLFALPLIKAAMGDPGPLPRAVSRIAAHDLPATSKRREFLRAVSDGETVRLASSQDSSALVALASANCLIDRPAGSDPIRAGERVAVYNLQNG
ncbi:MAG: molybdopterin molybdotransferase MoeA [Pseudomonadota bacterium]